MKKPNSERIALTFGVLVFLFAIAFYISAWTEPPQTPPQGNVDTPINIGSAAQTKLGDLNIGSGLNYWLTKVGDSLALKNDSGINKFILGQDGNLILEGDITVGSATIKGDSSVSDELNSDMVDDYHASDLLAGSGSSSMPLQGNIVLKDGTTSYGISTVPISLPGENCQIQVTACDLNTSSPPVKMVVAAASTGIDSYIAQDSASGWDVVCGDYGGLGSYYCGGSPRSTCISRLKYCQTGDICGGQAFYKAGSISGECSVCYSINQQDGYCCPPANPIYDPVTRKCFAGTPVDTTQIGNCTTLSATLSGQSYVTFMNSNDTINSNSDYVAVSYSCPQ